MRRAVQPPAADMVEMSYSEDLATSAQAWIDNCSLSHGPPSTRMINGYELGENLFYSSSPCAWKDVINAWHSEVERYTYPNGSTDGRSIGHYTQVVWNTSYKVGCGMTRCPDGIYYYGCRYYRAGNFRGWPPYKAGSTCASCPDACVNNLCTNPCPYIDHFLNCPEMAISTGCNNLWVGTFCIASCQCAGKIIPIGKR
ncbi:cysteine-rich venom protein isoform X2 [Betta splendens]|nr:cysteine-rich venom protein isoform X2 [Betta splendens]